MPQPLNASRIALVLMLATLLVSTSAFGQRRSKPAAKPEPASEPAVPAGPPIVARVLSGDLLELQSGERVRLMGADAPVMANDAGVGQEPFASQAQHFVEELVLGKEITIKNLGLTADEYGRRIGLVYLGETWLDYELIRQGWAVVQANPYLDTKSRLQLVEAQREARSGFRGIWNSTSPIEQPPREFRAANNISEGDDAKVDDWKRKTPAGSEKRASNNNNQTVPATKPASANNNNSGNSGNNVAGDNSGLDAAAETIEALREIQNHLSDGLRSSDLNRMITIAREKFSAIGSTTDRALLRDLKDSLDAYELALEAFKRRELAKDDERAQYKKYIDGALQIAERSFTSATQRYAQVSKRK